MRIRVHKRIEPSTLKSRKNEAASTYFNNNSPVLGRQVIQQSSLLHVHAKETYVHAQETCIYIQKRPPTSWAS